MPSGPESSLAAQKFPLPIHATPARKSDRAGRTLWQTLRVVVRRDGSIHPGPRQAEAKLRWSGCLSGAGLGSAQDRLPDRLRGPLPVTACVADALADSTRQGKVRGSSTIHRLSLVPVAHRLSCGSILPKHRQVITSCGQSIEVGLRLLVSYDIGADHRSYV